MRDVAGSSWRGGVTLRRVAFATAAEEGQGPSPAVRASGAMEAATAVPAASSGALVPAGGPGTAVATGKEATPPAPRRPKKILDEEAYIEVGRWAREAPLSWHRGSARGRGSSGVARWAPAATAATQPRLEAPVGCPSLPCGRPPS